MIKMILAAESFSDFWSFISGAVHCFYETFKVFLSTFLLLADNIGAQTWMPSVILNVGTVSLLLIIVLRVVGR